MSYESIASSVFTNLRSKLREAPSRLTAPLRRVFGRRKDETAEPQASPETRARAAEEIESFTRKNPDLFMRLERWNEREKRLREEGTPSESAANRARRSRRDILEGLDEVRSIFAAGSEEERAFDEELRRVHPELFPDEPE